MTQLQTRFMNGKGCKQNLDSHLHSNFAGEYRSSVAIDPPTCQCASSPRWIKPKMAAAVKKIKLLRLQTSLLRVEVAVAQWHAKDKIKG